MSDLQAPESPLVTYPPDAARPGYNFHDFYRSREEQQAAESADDEDYVPIQGDEDFGEMTGVELATDPTADNSQLASSLLSPSFLCLISLVLLSRHVLAGLFRQLRLQLRKFVFASLFRQLRLQFLLPKSEFLLCCLASHL